MSIVGQLRLTANVAPYDSGGWTRLNDDCRAMLREAADEIERLQGIIRRRLDCDGSNGRWEAKEHFDLTEEMRAATRKF